MVYYIFDVARIKRQLRRAVPVEYGGFALLMSIFRIVAGAVVNECNAVNGSGNSMLTVVNCVLDAAGVGHVGVNILFGSNLVERHDNVRLSDLCAQRKRCYNQNSQTTNQVIVPSCCEIEFSLHGKPRFMNNLKKL